MADAQTQPAAKTTTRKRRTRAKKTGAAAKKKENPIGAFMLSTQDVDPSRLPPVPEGDDVAAERRVRLLDALAAIDPDDPATPGDPLPLGLYVLGVLNDELDGCDVILHDRDLADPVWSPSKGDYLPPTRKAAHVHFLGHFDPAKKLTVPAIAARLGVPEHMVEKPQKGRNAFDNLLAYMVHAKDAGKYQYAPADVHTLRGEDYTALYNRRRYAWERGRATKTARGTRELLPWLLSEVRAGRISRKELLLTPAYYDTYALHMLEFDRALEAYAQLRMARAVADLEAGLFRKTIVFVHGPAGTGKSRWLAGVCRYLREAYGWDTCRVTSGHVFDDYRGEEVLVFDDVAASALLLDDWLRLLDPPHASRASARYHNKPPLAPRVIFVATNQNPAEFFGQLLPTADEALFSAALRRISTVIDIVDPRAYGAYNVTVGLPRDAAGGPTTEYNRIVLAGLECRPRVAFRVESPCTFPSGAFYTAPAAGVAAASLVAERSRDVDPAVPVDKAADYVVAALAPAVEDGALPSFAYDGAAPWVLPPGNAAVAFYTFDYVKVSRAGTVDVVTCANDAVPVYGLDGAHPMPPAPDHALPPVAPAPASLPAPAPAPAASTEDTPSVCAHPFPVAGGANADPVAAR